MVRRGLRQSEITNRRDAPARFVQMWLLLAAPGLGPFVEQRAVERTNQPLPLMLNDHPQVLLRFSDAAAASSLPERGRSREDPPEAVRRACLPVVAGGPM